jgi:hypothetical protein
MCAELRAYESSGAGSLSVKRADDASAIAWHVDGSDPGNDGH